MSPGYEVQQIGKWWYVVRTTRWRYGERLFGPFATKERAEARVPVARA